MSEPDKKPAPAFLVPFGAQIPSQGEGVKQYALVLSAAILSDPEQITNMPNQPTTVLRDRAGAVVTELAPVVHIGISPEAITILVVEHLRKAFEAAEKHEKQRVQAAKDAEEQDIRVLTEALQDVVKTPEGRAMVEAVGTYTLPVVVEALVNRLSNGMPLFVTTEDVERHADFHFGSPKALHSRADLLATQIGAQPAAIAARVMEGLQRNRYELFKLVTDRFKDPEKYGSGQWGEQVHLYCTPPELADDELLSLIPDNTAMQEAEMDSEEEPEPEEVEPEQSEPKEATTLGIHSGTRRK